MFNITLSTVQLAQFGGGIKPPVDSQYSPVEAATDSTTALNTMTKMISNIVAIGTVAAGLFFIVYFLMATYAWITSEGDAGKLKKARDQMIHAVIGLALVVSAYAVIGLIGSIVGIDILNPATILREVAPTTPTK